MKMKILIFILAICCLARPLFAEDDLIINEFIFDNLLQYGSGVVNYISNGTQLEIDQRVNIANSNDKLIVVAYGFKNSGSALSDSRSAHSLEALSNSIEDDSPLTLTKPLLNYPNPARQKEGVEIRYGLSKNADIELQIYDMAANLVFKNQYSKGAEGAKVGYNRLYLTMDSFDNYALSAGVYFYLLVNEGVVLATGKMAIVP